MRNLSMKIENKLNKIVSETVYVGTLVALSKKDIFESNLKELGFDIVDNSLFISDDLIVPSRVFGMTAKKNIEGYEIIHHDLPKIYKDVYMGIRPKWGKWSNGVFDLWHTRLAKQKTYIQPKGLELQIKILEKNIDKDSWKIFIRVHPNIIKTDKETILFAVNLLNEIVGAYDVYPADQTAEQIIEIMRVHWELFPPDSKDFALCIRNGLKNMSPERQAIINERIEVFESLKPKQLIYGKSFTSRYFGALLADNLVVFENYYYGNATYILYDNWESISKMSRTAIMTLRCDYDRVVHNSHWKNNLKKIVEKKLFEITKEKFEI